jgi:hypothetical protein
MHGCAAGIIHLLYLLNCHLTEQVNLQQARIRVTQQALPVYSAAGKAKN